MSRLLSTYQEKQRLLDQLANELKQLESDDGLKQEIEFKEHLEALMKDFNKDARDVLELLQPGRPAASTTAESSSGTRRKRKLKIYKNPNTNEVIETRGGNHKQLKAWKDEVGAETVEGWLIEERE